MRLSKVEQAFLGQASLNAAQPLPETAKMLEVSTSKLRYAVSSLLTRGIIRVAPNIDRSLLGLTDYHVFFSISAKSESARTNFINQLARASGVVFVAELGGNFQFESIISCRSAFEASRLLDDIATKARIDIRGKSVASSVAFCLFAKRYLSHVINKRFASSLRLVGENPVTSVIELDATDSKLLALLSVDGDVSLRDLGSKFGISHATVQYRMDRLKKLGVLRGLYYDVEPLQYGYHDFVWQLSVSHSRAAMEDKLFKIAATTPSISYLATYFGEWDFELGLEVAEPRLVNHLVQKLSELLGPEFVSVRLMMRFGQLALRHFPF